MEINHTSRFRLARAIEESGRHPSDLVRGITTERTLSRWISGEVARPNPFQSRQLARRLGLPHEELFK